MTWTGSATTPQENYPWLRGRINEAFEREMTQYYFLFIMRSTDSVVTSSIALFDHSVKCSFSSICSFRPSLSRPRGANPDRLLVVSVTNERKQLPRTSDDSSCLHAEAAPCVVFLRTSMVLFSETVADDNSGRAQVGVLIQSNAFLL